MHAHTTTQPYIMKRTHPDPEDTDDDDHKKTKNQQGTTTMTPFDKLPTEALFHIFSFVCVPTLEHESGISSPRFEIVSCLDETLEDISEYLEEKV